MASPSKSSDLPLFTVYENPSDYPGKFVVRYSEVVFDADTGHAFQRVATQPSIVADTLEAARKAIPDGLVRLDRHPGDDPVIVEVWL